MLSSFLGVLPILTTPLCALALSCDQSPIPLLCLPLIFFSNWHIHPFYYRWSSSYCTQHNGLHQNVQVLVLATIDKVTTRHGKLSLQAEINLLMRWFRDEFFVVGST
jgi:hypothetical protein